MTTLEIALAIINTIAIPWLIFVTKALMSICSNQNKIYDDIKWLKREHEPVSGMQHWKNPGLVEAVTKLDDTMQDLKDWLVRKNAS